MGKIRIKTLGTEEVEKEQSKRDQKRRAVKRAKKEGVAPEKILDKNKPESKPASKRKVRVRSKRYNDIKSKVDRSKFYPITDALKLLKDTSNTKFKGAVEAHFNLMKKPKDLGLKKDKSFPISYERKFPLAHAKIGSIADTDKKLSDQLDTVIKKIRTNNIAKLTLSSTMGPGIKISL